MSKKTPVKCGAKKNPGGQVMKAIVEGQVKKTDLSSS